MENLFEELGIPKRYIKSTCRDNRFIVLVHKTWLKSLVKHMKLIDFIEKPQLEIWPNQDDDDGIDNKSWLKIFITIYNKKHDVKVIPLPRIRSTSKEETSLLFPKFMQYIHQTNYKNLWKDAYKKYNNNNNNNNKGESSKDTTITLVDYNDVLKEILLRIYGCPIVNLYDNCLNIERSKSNETHLNILPALCGIETLNAIFLLHYPYIEHNLNDCITFSPAILNKSYTKPLFIIYQLLNVLKSLHSNSLTLGDITLNDVYLNEDMWIYIFPMVHSNIYIEENCVDQQLQQHDCRKYGHKFDCLTLKCEICGIKTYDRIQLTNDESLEELCQLWINGQISNFTYLSILNRLSGRQLNNPNCHYVYPWVTDFQTPYGRNWRDLKKSKYRLNKGDRQLDLTYKQNTTLPSHHVSDILSSITYYVYMARRTSKTILCKYVRTKWVPAEYPSSIQRLQEWTPDECIPEFFTDPNVFRSIHDDLDDLDIPQWATSPEDFIERHRELLESQHVSERLHHWIDLTFGYKLSGTAAIKAKNVCLNLVDDHSKLTKSGIVQLFTHPHPAKCTNLPYFGKKPPKIIINKPIKYKSSKDRSTSPASLDTKSDDNLDDCNNNDDDDDDNDNNNDDCDDVTITNSNRSPLGLTRFLSRSRSSLNDEQKSNKQTNTTSNQRSSSVGPKNPTFNSYTNPKTNKTIYLPKDYKPEQALENLEKRYNFFSKTFHIEQKKTTIKQQQQQINQQSVEKDDDLIVQNAFTNLIFTENFERNRIKQLNSFTKRSKKNQIICNYSEIISSRRIRELQIFGCLIIEIFMSKQLRSLGGNHPNLRFQQRLNYCLTIIKSCQNDIPICIRRIIDLLLIQPIDDNNNGNNNFKYPPVNDIGLPPPSAHLLLEPLLHCLIPFPKLLPNLYRLIWNLKEFDLIAYELEIYYYFDCNGKQCKEYENLECTKLKLVQNIGECKVKICAKQLDEYFNNNDNQLNNELIDILILNIKQLINDPSTSILTVWYLFDTIARFLGTKKTSELLLDTIIKLYENENYYQLLPSYYYKIAKLYHHSFLLRLIVRFGLKCFLDNFIQPLVEAVGKYKDYDHNNDNNNVILHDHSDMKMMNQQKKQSHLKTMSDNNEQQQSNRNDDSSSTDLIDKKIELEPEPELFQFDNDQNNLNQQKDDELKNLIEQLELNVTNVVDEEGLDATTTINDNFEQFKINLNNTTDSTDDDNNDTITSNDTIKYDVKISEMSSDSLIWLSHRLGPVLTARYLTRNLLKMLTLCYVGLDNLNIINNNNKNSVNNDINSICIVNSYVQGDRNAIKVLQCLTNIAGLYGEQFILFQYTPHMSELIVLCKRKLTLNLEGGLISSLALLKHIIPYLTDSTLMEQLQDVILKNILQPIVRLLGSNRYSFPNGSISRNILARKFIDTLYILSIRLGVDMARTHLITPTLQRFFLNFDKSSNDDLFINNDEIGDNDYVELCRDGTMKEWSLIDGKTIQIHNKDQDCYNNYNNNEEIVDELNAVFTPELAYIAYLPFLHFLGLESMKISLKNHENIQRLCEEYENCGKTTIPIVIKLQQLPPLPQQQQQQLSSSIGSNVAVIGNRLDVQQQQLDMDNRLDLLNLVSKRIDNNDRHLRGNWLAYWEHEIGRSTKDQMFNFKQIKLQQFIGHTNSVKCLYLLDNENSFISGSRDKTIKLWSLRSHGDGNHIQTCQYTYGLHKKSILSLIFIDTLRLIASCDSLINIWDPFMGINIGNIESTKYQPVNLLKNLPTPSQLFYATTTDSILHIVDTRLCSFIYDMKLNLNQTINGLIRCLTVSPSGYWVAAGQSSGFITILDSRTGFVISTWRAHESEVLQLIAYNDTTLISTSLDQTISVWSTNDGRLKFHMRGATEPVHCLNIYNNELISGTTANRIGVHTSIDIDASFSSTKLRSDAFKGLLTSMTVLPLNRLLLLGADTGNISLLC